MTSSVKSKMNRQVDLLRKQLKLKAVDTLSKLTLRKLNLLAVGQKFLLKKNKLIMTKLMKKRISHLLSAMV